MLVPIFEDRLGGNRWIYFKARDDDFGDLLLEEPLDAVEQLVLVDADG